MCQGNSSDLRSLFVRICRYGAVLFLFCALVSIPVSKFYNAELATGATPFGGRGSTLWLTSRGYMLCWDEVAPAPLHLNTWRLSDSRLFDAFRADFEGPFRSGQTRSGWRAAGLMYADYMSWRQITWTHGWNAAISFALALLCWRSPLKKAILAKLT